ncbi:Hpt domain-containing protein [Nocardioides sp. SR21]|uniref:Hpt domain-containing protein n=1 Tax=Nocardioides sp. SR21 TaxID=2919501 RepID=UPI001FAA8AC2|nr:Hpt domain-containing protein [Nocardioides sp. SR21]
MSELRSENPVVFDSAVVSNLTGHADDAEFARVFVGRFQRMLPERVRRIDDALGEQDLTDAMDAVLSLKSAAGTVGAGELFVIAGIVEAQLRRRDFEAATSAAADLPAAAERADQALTAYLGA